jgi:hypothetical protein
MTQAPKGGCVGVNGDTYEGGQFLPASEDTIKGAKKVQPRKPSKCQIEPYVWVLCPDGQVSIFELLSWHRFNRTAGTFAFNSDLNYSAAGMGGAEGAAYDRGLIEAYNGGERFVAAAIRQTIAA